VDEMKSSSIYFIHCKNFCNGEQAKQVLSGG
jgi:hypothetical protein